MTYQEALSFLFSQLPMFSRVGAAAYKPGLDTSINLDNYFGNPHRKFKSIHVGGTNGKGSTSHTLAAMLQSQGYRTGLYTSPHLVDFRERIRVNGEMIPQEAVVDFVERWQKCDYDGHPSFFELTMMMAFDWFARAEVDYAVIEVGMGGRLDSTNIITPEACIITNISPDHMQFLGDTLPKIASEKAGIIKKDIPITIGEAEGEVRRVFEERALEVGAPIRFAQDDAYLKSCRVEADGGWNCIGTHINPAMPQDEVPFYMQLAGEYQMANTRTLLSAVDMLRSAGICISEEAEKEGFARVCDLTGLAGRWMRLNESPLTIADTGHNEAGLRYNMHQLGEALASRPEGKLQMVMGFVSDKDVDHILHLLPREKVDYYLTQASVPRAMPYEQLAEKFAEEGLPVAGKYPKVKEAFEAAKAKAKPSDIIYIGGSTFVVADLLTE